MTDFVEFGSMTVTHEAPNEMGLISDDDAISLASETFINPTANPYLWSIRSYSEAKHTYTVRTKGKLKSAHTQEHVETHGLTSWEVGVMFEIDPSCERGHVDLEIMGTSARISWVKVDEVTFMSDFDQRLVAISSEGVREVFFDEGEKERAVLKRELYKGLLTAKSEDEVIYFMSRIHELETPKTPKEQGH